MKNLVYCAVLALAISFAVGTYSKELSIDLYGGLVRLHIIAQSDSAADQAVKLSVRDEILKQVPQGLSPEETAECAAKTANEVLKENGFDYGATAEFTTAFFPRKKYREICLPSGNYRAVRVILGEGKGQNWWCVLYPPVCMADVNGSEMSEKARKDLKDNVSEESYDLITGDITVKFRVAELIGNIMRK